MTPYFSHVADQQPLPVRLTDDHELSTVWRQLQLLKTSGGGLAHMIINERTSLFLVTRQSTMYIDMHFHGSYGAVIVKGSFRAFSEFIWDLEGHARETLGNLVCTDF